MPSIAQVREDIESTTSTPASRKSSSAERSSSCRKQCPDEEAEPQTIPRLEGYVESATTRIDSRGEVEQEVTFRTTGVGFVDPGVGVTTPFTPPPIIRSVEEAEVELNRRYRFEPVTETITSQVVADLGQMQEAAYQQGIRWGGSSCRDHQSADGWIVGTRGNTWITNASPQWTMDCRSSTGSVIRLTTRNAVTTDRIIPTTSAVDGGWIIWNQAESKREKLRRRIREQMERTDLRGLRANHPRANFSNVRENEINALHLLRSMVDPAVFRKYLRYGFVTVRASSGLVYQIQRNNQHMKVWDRGQVVCELCVSLPGVPATDEVIAKMLMAECDEIEVWNRANVYWDARPEQRPAILARRAA